jgi:hypothetical protein
MYAETYRGVETGGGTVRLTHFSRRTEILKGPSLLAENKCIKLLKIRL